MNYKYLFGPVPSRRLGVSLGVDVIPFKTCTFNCIYCECGQTTDFTISRKPYIKAIKIIKELKNFLSNAPKLDYITFSGGGEPTLNSDIGEVISFLKDEYPEYRVALLTNASLFRSREVRDSVKRCDVIIPSFDAVSEKIYRKINDPYSGINIDDIISGIKKIKKESAAQIWLEIFIVPGINDIKEEIGLFKKVILEIAPYKIQLNTLDRPGTKDWVLPASHEKLLEIKDFLQPPDVEIIGNYGTTESIESYSNDVEQRIISMLKRRPCTVKDLSRVFSLHMSTLNKCLQELENSDKITRQKKGRGVFYKIK